MYIGKEEKEIGFEYLNALSSKLRLFPNPSNPERHITGDTARRLFIKHVKESPKLPKKITPHKFRHTFATRLYRKGVRLLDIRELLF